MIQPYQVLCVQSHIRQVYRDDASPPNLNAIQENWDRASALIGGRIGWFGAPRLIVFPEFFLQGYLPQRSVQDWVDVGVRIPGPLTDEIGRAARKYGSYLAANVWEIDDAWPGRFFDTTFILNPDGEVILRYRKHFGTAGYTFPADIHGRFVEVYGEKALFPVVDTEIGRLASIICFDVNFPELTRALAFNGAEVFVMPTGEPRGGYRESWEAAKRTRAYENIAYLATANRGHWLDSNLPEDESNGWSEIVDYNGRVLVSAETGGECVVRAEIDVEALRRRRASWRANYLAQVPTELYARVYAEAKSYPLNYWADKPIASLEEFSELGRRIMEQLYERGVLVPPSTAERVQTATFGVR